MTKLYTTLTHLPKNKRPWEGVLTEPPGALNESSKFRKNKKHLFQKGNIMVSTAEMIKAVQELSKHLPPVTEEDIVLVDQNESLSIIQKFLIKRRLRRIISEQSNHP